MSDTGSLGDQTANREPAEGGRDEVDESASSPGDAAGGAELVTNTGADTTEGEAPTG